MRILHTSDWHIGKKLQSRSRLEEQKKTLDQLAYIVKNGDIDLVLVAGDIFDVSVPSAEAEELFYSSALDIAKSCHFVAIAGNHDDPNRLSAPRGIAKAANITLIGGLDNSSFFGENTVDNVHSETPKKGTQTANNMHSETPKNSTKSAIFSNKTLANNKNRIVASGEGWLRFDINGQPLNLALLPYPSLTRTERLNDMQGESYQEKMKSLIDLCCGGFTKDAVNIFCSHLFITGSQSVDGELGGAQMLPISVLPDCTYNALGHIHKPQAASKSKNAYYSGSILNYSFDDTYDKRHIIIDTDRAPNNTSDFDAELLADDKSRPLKNRIFIEDVPITTGKKPIRLRAASVAEAIELLENHAGYYVELTYAGLEPLRPSDVTRLKAFDSFCKLGIETAFMKKELINRQSRDASQLFVDFFKSSHGAPPDDSVIELFLKVIAGEEI